MVRVVRVVRNVEFNKLFDSFFISAISTILLIRFVLKLTGYPQIGGSTLHISHLLPGTLMMLAAVLILLAAVNRSARNFSAILAGVGFGFAWDELGKFITKNNNYFFSATPGLIYLTFVVLYLIVRRLAQRRFRQDDYLTNVLDLIKDGVIKELDSHEYEHARQLLSHVSKEHPLYSSVDELLEKVKPHGAEKKTFLSKILEEARRPLEILACWRAFPYVVISISVAYGLTCLASAIFFFSGVFRDSLQLHFNLLKGEQSDFIGGLSLLASAVFVFIGSLHFVLDKRRRAFRFFEQALLINIFVSQVVLFFKSQELAMVGLAVTLILLVNLQILIEEAKQRHLPVRP